MNTSSTGSVTARRDSTRGYGLAPLRGKSFLATKFDKQTSAECDPRWDEEFRQGARASNRDKE